MTPATSAERSPWSLPGGGVCGAHNEDILTSPLPTARFSEKRVAVCTWPKSLVYMLSLAADHSHRRVCQLRRIRIVQMTVRIGGMGKANPHQKTAPAGSNASARTAPD